MPEDPLVRVCEAVSRGRDFLAELEQFVGQLERRLETLQRRSAMLGGPPPRRGPAVYGFSDPAVLRN